MDTAIMPAIEDGSKRAPIEVMEDRGPHPRAPWLVLQCLVAIDLFQFLHMRFQLRYVPRCCVGPTGRHITRPVAPAFATAFPFTSAIGVGAINTWALMLLRLLGGIV